MTTYVIDTSVFLALGAKALRAFSEGEVVVPLAVIRELENKRHDPNLGLAARSVLRELDDLALQGDLGTGVKNIRVETNHVDTTDLPDSVKQDRTTDIRILAVAKHLDAVLVTKDVPLRVLANVCGVKTEDSPTSVKLDTSFDEIPTYHVDDEVMELLYENGHVKSDIEMPINSAAILKTHSESSSALVIAKRGWELKLVQNNTLFKIEGKSAEQRIALTHLLDPDVPVVSLGGYAGTGKTMLALAAAVEQVLQKNSRYKKVVVFRSMYAVGQQELGFLPGEAEDKFSPWTAAVYDALDAFLEKSQIDKLKKEKLIEVAPLTFIRGRTFTNTIIIVDEAQLLEYSVLLTALTRVGRGTKLFLTHDVSQRDNLRVGRHDGIYAVIQRLAGDKLFAHVTLRKSERSAVAEMAARLLDDGIS